MGRIFSWILLVIIIICFFLMLSSCHEAKQVGRVYPSDIEIVHYNRVYKLAQIKPCNGCNSIWIMYPKDSLNEMPLQINYDQLSGKVNENQTVIVLPK